MRFLPVGMLTITSEMTARRCSGKRSWLAAARHQRIKQAFDQQRRTFFEREMTNPQSGDTWWFAHQLAAEHGKRLIDPYLDRAVFEHFLRFDHAQLSPLKKPIVREALASHLAGLPKGSIAVGVRLQTGGGVSYLFEALLRDARINRFNPQYSTVSALCQRWGAEVVCNSHSFRHELLSLTQPERAHSYICKPGRYEPYGMASVRASAESEKFTAISLFAGGGGSCVGLSLAGGHVVLTNEFVREAAHTYRSNFPGSLVNERDIREIAASRESVIAFLAQAGAHLGEIDVIAASPPCCEYSTGKRPHRSRRTAALLRHGAAQHGYADLRPHRGSAACAAQGRDREHTGDEEPLPRAFRDGARRAALLEWAT